MCAGNRTGAGTGAERLNFDVPGSFAPQGKFVTSQAKLHGISQGSHADQLDGGARSQAHIKEAAPQLALAVDTDNTGALIDG